MKCTVCSLELQQGWNFCPNCKKQLVEVVSNYDSSITCDIPGKCPVCSCDLNSNWNFCPVCSNKVDFDKVDSKNILDNAKTKGSNINRRHVNFCAKCGNRIGEGYEFCICCGAKIDRGRESESDAKSVANYNVFLFIGILCPLIGMFLYFFVSRKYFNVFMLLSGAGFLIAKYAFPKNKANKNFKSFAIFLFFLIFVCSFAEFIHDIEDCMHGCW